MSQPSYLNFKREDYPWKPSIDYRSHPELYRVGKGEQGVLICEPYKSEIGQYWRFKRRRSPNRVAKKYFNCLQVTWKQGILSERIWPANICRWVIPGPGVMRTTRR